MVETLHAKRCEQRDYVKQADTLSQNFLIVILLDYFTRIRLVEVTQFEEANASSSSLNDRHLIRFLGPRDLTISMLFTLFYLFSAGSFSDVFFDVDAMHFSSMALKDWESHT